MSHSSLLACTFWVASAFAAHAAAGEAVAPSAEALAGALERINTAPAAAQAVRAELSKRGVPDAALETALPAPPRTPSPEADVEFFEKKIRPLLVASCFACHGPDKQKNGLRLDSAAAMLAGGQSGPAIVPGAPGKSKLIEVISYAHEIKMPPDAPLPPESIADLTEWIKQGAPWPQSALAPAPKSIEERIAEGRKTWWAFQPVKALAPPAVTHAGEAWTPIDKFVIANLETHQLAPGSLADKRTLIRRATFDLTGLPPTPQEIDAFLADTAPDAYARVVDRLLASPHYGERWGRHWLDVMRYTDSFDSRADARTDPVEIWRYRDWVVNAFNTDLPYDQFVKYQIAGDLLAEKKDSFDANGLIATGMLAIGNWPQGDADKQKMVSDIVDDQVDVVSRGFLGITMACARCHDHKFDPIATTDYYGMAGIFFSSHILPGPGAKTEGSPILHIPNASKAAVAARDQRDTRIDELEKKITAARESRQRTYVNSHLNDTAAYIMAAWKYRQAPKTDASGLGAVAQAGHLDAAALRRWVQYLHLGQFDLLTNPTPMIQGKPGLDGLQGDGDTPSVVANSTAANIPFLSINQPPHSLSVHPGPTGPVAIIWQSPIEGAVNIEGKVADADPTCGDGIAWTLNYRHGDNTARLGEGAIENAGAMALSLSGPGTAAQPLTVHLGGQLVLAVLPKGSHACDTTVVNWRIVEIGGEKRLWDVTDDVAGNLYAGGAGNPHSDKYGHAETWSFADLAVRPKPPQSADPGPAGVWARALETVARDDATEAEVLAAANAAQAAIIAQAQAIAAVQPPLDPAKVPGPYAEFIGRKGPFWLQQPPEKAGSPDADILAKDEAELGALQMANGKPIDLAVGIQEGGVPDTEHAGIHDVQVHKRGSYTQLGDPVPRRFPLVLAGDRQPPITEGSGRLQLAEWVASASNPLTARVMVNRIWQHHFGEGLARTPGNFGKLGEAPDNPALLDYLAAEFVKSGWSVKAMHRAIMMSRTYQQSSSPSVDALKVDPDNRWLSRMNRRRLEAEAIRDNILSVTGDIDAAIGGPATPDFNSPRRTLYLKTVRSDRTSFNMLFDAADPTSIIDRRTESTVAPQALFLMNNPFLLAHAKTLAQQSVANTGTDAARIAFLYAKLYGRPPTEPEVNLGSQILDGGNRNLGGAQLTQQQRWEEYCQILLCANEFIYVD